jgi:tetrahydromethanopterin S-methyltransferase subunit B
MAYIIVLPEFGLVADPMVGLVTSAGESFSPILEKVSVLEATSDDLVNMLAIGGSITSFWYGLAVGLFIAGIIAFQLIKVG